VIESVENNMNKLSKLLMVTVLSVFVVACSGGGSSDSKNNNPEVTNNGGNAGPNPGPGPGPGSDPGSDPDPNHGVISGGEGYVSEDNVKSATGILTDSTNPNRIFEEVNEWGKYGRLQVLSDGSWTYTLDSNLSDPLGANELATDEFSIAVGAGDNFTVIVIEVTGADDAYTFEPDSPLATLIVGSRESANGILSLHDVDGNTPSFSEKNIESTYGNFNINSSGDWEYILNDKADSIKSGGSVKDTINFQLTDGAQQSVTFSIVTKDPNGSGSFELSLDQKRAMLDRHNHFRQRCASGQSGEGEGPKTAGNMQTLFWDDALAKMAKERASACFYGHLGDSAGIRDSFDKVKSEVSFVLPEGYVEIGENVAIYFINPPASQYDGEQWAGAVQAWYDESYAYNWETGQCHDDTCGHWAQVCYGETRYVGCAVQECDRINGVDNPAYNDGAHVAVCNYFPAVDKSVLPFVDNFGFENCRTCLNYDMPFCADNMCTGGISKNWNASGKTDKDIDQCTDGLGRDIVPCKFGDHPPPAKVSGFKYRIDGMQVFLSWNHTIENDGVLHYELSRDEELLVNTREPSYKDSGLELGKNYRYKVIAVDHSGRKSQEPAFLDVTISNN
jgi:VCBS repeat-containing protein